MKASEVHQLSAEELQAEEARVRGRLYELRSQAVTQKLEGPHQIQNLRRDVARLLTEKRVRQMRDAKA